MTDNDRLKMPPEQDFGFWQRRKHDKWRAVEAPVLAPGASVSDTHAHVHMLPDPAWELARCAANNVRFVCEICDPSDDELGVEGGFTPGAAIAQWLDGAAAYLEAKGCAAELPVMRFAAGVHPHNAKLYDADAEARLMESLSDPLCSAVGEIGLDYHYDLSPRDEQRRVFRRQIDIAKDVGLPIALHLRGGEDAEADNAHREAFEILKDVGFPVAGTLLHCCALPPEELRPWIDAGCYIAYGGALTFKKGDDARAGAQIVPADRLLLETDSPYMAPEPIRGSACTPAHVVFTAACLTAVRDCDTEDACSALFGQLNANAARFLVRERG